MTRSALALCALCVANVGLVAPLLAGERDAAPSKGEVELAKLLEGRTAGEPLACLGPAARDRMEVVDGTALVFRDGDTLYVNRTTGAAFLDSWVVPAFYPTGSRLCRLDRVELRDRTSAMHGPVVTLEAFVPYRKPESSQQPQENGA